jgi:hypothetical protein
MKARAFAERKAAAVGGKRLDGGRGLAGLERGERRHRLPGEHDAGHDQRLGASRQREVDLAALHRLRRFGDRDRGRRTGHRVGQHRPMHALAHRHMRGGRVRHERGYRQRRHARAAAVGEIERRGAAHAAADVDADALRLGRPRRRQHRASRDRQRPRRAG